MGNEKQLKKAFMVMFWNVDHDGDSVEDTLNALELFSTQKAAEQHACCLIQKEIESNYVLDPDDEDQAQIGFKINEMISKENYSGAVKEFNRAMGDDYYGDYKIIIEEKDFAKMPNKPKVFDKDFFAGLPDPEQKELEEWQYQVSSRKTKLGFEAWKKEKAA